MSDRWQALADTLDVMFSGNFPDYYVQARNRTFTRPTAPKTSGAIRYVYYDFSADHYEITQVGRTREIPGSLGGLVFAQGDAGDVTLAFIGRLDGIADAWAQTEGANNLYFHGVIPQELVYQGDANSPKWAVREWSLPFLYLSPVDSELEGILGGISSSTIPVHFPSGALLDFAGSDFGTWRRVSANEGEPSCLGMVSVAPNSSGDAMVTLSGFVRIAGGHGFGVGPLYLSQMTAGAAGSKPESGLERKVAEVLNATDLIILGGAEVVA